MAEPLVELLASTPVLGLDANEHALGDHFRERAAALLFVRHFG